MKSFKATSFRTKLILVFCITIIAIISMSSLTLTFTFSQQVVDEKKAHLDLLTAQVLNNFRNSAESATRQVYNMINSKDVTNQLFAMRNMSADSEGYFQNTQMLIYSINQMISANTHYDQIYIRLNNGLSFTNSHAPTSFIEESSLIIKDFAGSNYGAAEWFRSESGEVYIIRDIFSLSPIHHLGKVLARVRQIGMSDFDTSKSMKDSSIMILDSEGKPLVMFGEGTSQMHSVTKESVQIVADTNATNREFYSTVHHLEPWTAIGMVPISTINSVREAVVRIGIIVSALGALVGALAVMAVTRRMTRQMKLIVKSMDEFSSGNITLTVPVVSGDEIGQMALHFNAMIAQTRNLLEEVVSEVNQKCKAEYEMLEYKYRSLQSQINPHFIYNAMETVNALAKLDGNEDICHVVRHIAEFFRQNANNMEKRFIPIYKEFESLKQYANIYRYIHGETLSTPFLCSRAAENALIPTMILQPVLENALIHGVRPASDEAVVSIEAYDETNEWLVVLINDNGEGMPESLVQRVLKLEYNGSDAPAKESPGIGLKNVLDRLHLIFGTQAQMTIISKSGNGTAVKIRIPLVYDESEIEARVE